MIGCLVNNVVFRTPINPDGGFSELLQTERRGALSAFEYGQVPFDKVVDALHPERRFEEHPLFQVLYLFESASPDHPEACGVEFQLDLADCDRESFWDLEFAARDSGTPRDRMFPRLFTRSV